MRVTNTEVTTKTRSDACTEKDEAVECLGARLSDNRNHKEKTTYDLANELT